MTSGTPRFGFLWEMRPYLRQVAGQLALGSIAGIIMNTAVVLPAILLGRAIDRALALERGEATAADVGWAALAFIAGTLLTEVPRIAKRWWLMTANARIRANVRADAFRGVLAWPMADVQRTPVGDLMARVIGDVEVLGVGVREFTIEIWDTVLFSISFVVAMLIFDPGLTLLALSPVPLAMVLAHAAGRWVARRTTRAREANAELVSVIQEYLVGLRVLRLFGRAGASVERVAELSRRFAATNLSLVRLKGGLQPIYTTLMTAGVVLIVWQGSERVVAGAMTVGAFVAYLELFLRFVNRGHRIPQLVNSVQSGAAAYARLRPLLARPLSVAGEPRFASFQAGHVAGIARAPVAPARPASGPAAVELRGVTFRYPDSEQPALRALDLRIPAGSLVAVTGPVGAGKSALARVILGIHPIESGTVLIADRPLAQLTNEERRGLIGYLPQDTLLFSGSLRENLTLSRRGGPRDDRFLMDAVSLAALEEDVRGFPGGLDTEIGELGLRISGGQRQRVGLARAIAAAAPGFPGLLVLDDPFSAVDVTTEARIVASLKEAFGTDAPPHHRATILLCSHRLAAFPHADLVIVLRDGRIEAMGTHTELIAAAGLYARIFSAQLHADPMVAEDGARR
jgi:ATP-binding cassette, subfamily B, multidrug efflux pump